MGIREKHSLWLRVHHWLNVPLIALMIWSGLLIYWANDVYPGFFPAWFYSAFGIDGRLADGLAIHFFIAWFFILNGLGYALYLAASGHWRELLPFRRDPAPAKFSPAQKFAYTGVFFLAATAVVSGFAIYKPVQLRFLTWIFTGYSGARAAHFAVMVLFSAFILAHLAQVLRAGWNTFRAMVAGFEVDDE